MKNNDNTIFHKTEVAIFISYAFYVFGRVLTRSQMSEINQSKGRISDLISLMKKHHDQISTVTSVDLWKESILALDSLSNYDQRGILNLYNTLDEQALIKRIQVKENSINNRLSHTFPYETLLEEALVLNKPKNALIVGNRLPVVAQYLESKSIQDISIIVFDKVEYVIAQIHAQHILNNSQIKIHFIQETIKLEEVLSNQYDFVFINEFDSNISDSPSYKHFFDVNSVQNTEIRLSIAWVILDSVRKYQQNAHIVSLVDERDLRSHSYSIYREQLVKESIVSSCISFGGRNTSLHLIELKANSERISMGTIEFIGKHHKLYLKKDLKTNQQVLSNRFCFLSPFDYSSKIKFNNVLELRVIAQINSGYQVGLKRLKENMPSDNQKEVRMVSMSHLNKFSVTTPNDDYLINVGFNVLAKFEIQENDILIASKSNDPKPTIVKNKPDQYWIANSSIIIVRLKDTTHFSPEYLFAYLTSEKGYDQLLRLQRGDVLFITTQQLSELLVEIPEKNDLERITHDVSWTVTQIQDHQRNIQELEERIANVRI
jgi:hypothetical protein